MTPVDVLEGLEPAGVWKRFSELTRIARPPKQEDEARKHVLGWAATHGFETAVDHEGNTVVRVPPTGRSGFVECRGGDTRNVARTNDTGSRCSYSRDMTDQTGREQIMKRTAIILGIAATMGVVPSVAAAGSATAQLRPQFKPQLVVQVFKPQPVSPARITIARATTYKASAYRISLFRAQSR